MSLNYLMIRSWGFSTSGFSAYTLITNVWSVLLKLALPAVALERALRLRRARRPTRSAGPGSAPRAALGLVVLVLVAALATPAAAVRATSVVAPLVARASRLVRRPVERDAVVRRAARVPRPRGRTGGGAVAPALARDDRLRPAPGAAAVGLPGGRGRPAEPGRRAGGVRRGPGDVDGLPDPGRHRVRRGRDRGRPGGAGWSAGGDGRRRAALPRLHLRAGDPRRRRVARRLAGRPTAPSTRADARRAAATPAEVLESDAR